MKLFDIGLPDPYANPYPAEQETHREALHGVTPEAMEAIRWAMATNVVEAQARLLGREHVTAADYVAMTTVVRALSGMTKASTAPLITAPQTLTDSKPDVAMAKVMRGVADLKQEAA